MDGRDLFSYDNSKKDLDESMESFDLNSFSTAKKRSSNKSRKKPKNTKQKILKWGLTCFLIGMIVAGLVLGGIIGYASWFIDDSIDVDLNDVEAISQKMDFTSTIYVQNDKGKWEEYQHLHGMYNRIWVDYDEKAIKEENKDYKGIPANLANAFIAIEDKDFKDHYGVDWKRTFGAVLNEVFHFSDKFGGSTITQQLVKNITDDREQDAGRKMREIMRARRLETEYSKDVILECYLNTIPMGHGTYGVQVAANYYFDKNVDELSVLECASLAAITKAPSYYAPDTNPENNKTRRNTVLYEMYTQGYITKEEYDEAKETELKLDINANSQINSYFVDALIQQLVDDLVEKYEYTVEKAEQLIYTGGYKIYATVDSDIQAVVDKAYLDVAKKAKKSSKGDPLWGAMTVMDYEGHVKAIAGGIGEKTSNRGFNCATDAKRQPGSTMKPLAVYAPAIEKGMINYSTILNDTKTKYGNWTPKNAGGGYSGNVTAQKALEKSINTIPVALANKMGVEISYEYTQKFGLSYLNAEADKNLSALGLGGTNGGVTTLQSAAAYAAFGNGGLYYTPTFYTKVTDQKGNIVLEQKSKPKMVIGEDTAFIMNKMLQNVIYGESGTGKSVASSVSKMKLFGKTGTSSSDNDKWFVGGSPYYVVSSWCGYETMQKMPSGNLNIAKNQWSTVMSKIHKGLKAKDYPESSYVTERYYCTKTGGLATDKCEKIAVGYYKTKGLPDVCQKHVGTVLLSPKEQEKLDKENAQNNSSNTSGTSSTGSTPVTSEGDNSSNSSENNTSGE